ARRLPGREGRPRGRGAGPRGDARRTRGGLVKRMVLLSALGASACVTAPLDLVSAARRASESGDLLRTLAYVDHVSPSHPRYKEALALAAEAERRIADSQRRVAGALRARLLG